MLAWCQVLSLWWLFILSILCPRAHTTLSQATVLRGGSSWETPYFFLLQTLCSLFPLPGMLFPYSSHGQLLIILPVWPWMSFPARAHPGSPYLSRASRQSLSQCCVHFLLITLYFLQSFYFVVYLFIISLPPIDGKGRIMFLSFPRDRALHIAGPQ